MKIARRISKRPLALKMIAGISLLSFLIAILGNIVFLFRRLTDPRRLSNSGIEKLINMQEVLSEQEQRQYLDFDRRTRLADSHKVISNSTLLVAPVDWWYVDSHGKILLSTTEDPLPLPWGEIPRPSDSQKAVKMTVRGELLNTYAVRRLKSEQERYLVLGRRFAGFKSPAVVDTLWEMLESDFLLATIAVGINLSLAAWYLRRRARLAAIIFRAIKSGNLNARFPISTVDEIGELMVLFNEMADEIERLVTRMREMGESRTRLLQELAHDVRTPLFSLGNVIGSLWENRDGLDRALLEDSLSLGRQEVDYFNRLIEDLFLLARVEEPTYRLTNQPIAIRPIIEEALRLTAESASGSARLVSIRLVANSVDGQLLGDPFMMRRLFRNALENARSFAQAEVTVSMETNEPEGISVRIRDDGPGFSPESLAAFGRRRNTRLLDTSRDGRLSLGLGSVIMKTIVRAHGGGLMASNWTMPDGRVGGGEVLIQLPVKVSPNHEKIALVSTT